MEGGLTQRWSHTRDGLWSEEHLKGNMKGMVTQEGIIRSEFSMFTIADSGYTNCGL